MRKRGYYSVRLNISSRGDFDARLSFFFTASNKSNRQLGKICFAIVIKAHIHVFIYVYIYV